MADPRYRPGVGWRVDRIPGKRVQKSEGDDGTRYRLPLMVLRNGEHRGDAGLWMSPSEAEALHAELCHVLADNDEDRRRPACSPTR
ncbi:hypothetical protein [Streptomyces sp. NPDC005955]|uniref:hypothetical protein n=1 Tax=Streptomyces sp. NPDC005955 TaxID=3364738 RepID=UPI00369F22ED